MIVLTSAAGGVAYYQLYLKPPPQKPESKEASKPPSVAVMRVVRTTLSQDISVEAEFRPYQEIDLHAKVAGYLKKLNVDVGDRVKEGQELAVLENPELENELEHALAMESRSKEEINRAKAELEEARLAYTRLAAVDKQQPGLIAQHEIDLARAKDAKAAASTTVCEHQLRVAQADIKRLQTMLGYSKIAAPFPAVVTKRFVDPGALIQAGTSSSTQAMPLVRLSDMDRLRLMFPVTAAFAARVKVGNPVKIQIPALDKTLSATVSRITHKLEMSTRTMDVEVDIDNPELAVLPGMYATVTLQVEERQNVLAVPVEAVSDRESPTVFLVNDENRVELRRVCLGLETPHEIEILDGLKENDTVVFGSRAKIQPGQQVEPSPVASDHAK